MTDTQQNTNRLTVRVAKVLYYKEESMWGIISVVPVKIEGNFEPKLNHWGNFVIRGNIPMAMKLGNEYDVEVSDLRTDAKYGEFYEVSKVHVEALDTVEAQQRFLEAIVTSYQYDRIIEAHPETMIVDLIKEGKIDLLAIKGIGEVTATKIKNQIEKNKDLGALMVELSDLNPTGRMLQKIVEFFDSSTMALYRVKQSLYNLCAVSGISFDKVDKVALLRGEDKFGGKRIGAYMEYYFDDIANQGHSWADERKFLEEAIETLDVNGSYVRNFMKSEEGERNFYWQQGDKRISSMRMYNNEKNTLKNLLRLAMKYQAPRGFDVEEAIGDAEDSLGIKYTDEQKDTIKEAIQHGVFVLNGKGGTGKTTVVKGIVEVLSAMGYSYQACALSGKASQVLLSKDIISATIHRTFEIGIKKDADAGEDNYVNHEVIVVDESSMVNASLFSILLSKIRSGSKIILVGDSGQLSGIGHGDVLRDLLETKFFKTVELMQIHRQAQDSGIIEVASLIRDGKQIIPFNFEGNKAFGVKGDMVVRGYNDKEAMPNDVRKVLVGQAKRIKSSQDLMDFQIVVAMKERGELSARHLNLMAQSIFNDLEKPYITHNGYDFREGDKVIVKGNSYEIEYFDNMEHYEEVKFESPSEFGIMETMMDMSEEEKNIYLQSIPSSNIGDLFNGTMGIIKKVHHYVDKDDKPQKSLFVEFENLGLMEFQPQELDVLELAYAVTCHRLQGSTIKNVIVVLDYSAFSLLCRQWVYTAITRASNKCVLLVQSSALQKAIHTDASGNRQTFLGDMIRELTGARGTLEEIKKSMSTQAMK